MCLNPGGNDIHVAKYLLSNVQVKVVKNFLEIWKFENMYVSQHHKMLDKYNSFSYLLLMIKEEIK